MQKRIISLSAMCLSALLAAVAEANSPSEEIQRQAPAFTGINSGDQREVSGIKLCWCPPGRFRMGS